MNRRSFFAKLAGLVAIAPFFKPESFVNSFKDLIKVRKTKRLTSAKLQEFKAEMIAGELYLDGDTGEMWLWDGTRWNPLS